MTDYVKSTNFASKDSLAVGNPLKIVKGTEIDSEFNNIATAVATKANIADPTFTGVPAAPTATAGTNTTQVATTAFVGTAVSNAVTAYDTALTVSTSQIEDAAVTSAKLSSGVAAANLGFNPIQQGGGTGQLSNKVYVGWSGSQLKAQVDSIDMGSFTMNSAFIGSNQSFSGANGYQKLPGGLILQWGSYDANAIDDRVVTLPIAFPNAGLSCSHTFNQPSGVSTFARFDNTSTITLTTGVFYSSGNPAGKHYWMAIGY